MNYPSVFNARKNFSISDSGFTPETGYSWVTIATPYGHFTGTARVHPTDLEKGYYTSITGQTIAHARAYIAYLKYQKQVMRIIAQEVKVIWARAPKNTTTSLALKKALKDYDENISDLTSEIKDVYAAIEERINHTAEYFNKARNK